MPGRNRPLFFEVRPSAIAGLGAFATRRIRKGTRLIEYRGERITPEEADRRYDDERNAQAHVLLFTVSKRTLIDAGVDGNEARYINHSCEPNCEAVLDAGRVYVEALRTISPGEELTYDYRLEREGDAEPGWEQRYACRCGTPSCRGNMLAPRPRSRKKRLGAKRAG